MRIRDWSSDVCSSDLIEAVTPLIGWALGSIAAEFVADWDHWIAFALLLVLGALMIRTGLRADEPEATPAIRHSFWLLAATGFATSIDAMAVGVSLAFTDHNILITAAPLGFATFLNVTLGAMNGRVLGNMAA